MQEFIINKDQIFFGFASHAFLIFVFQRSIGAVFLTTLIYHACYKVHMPLTYHPFNHGDANNISMYHFTIVFRVISVTAPAHTVTTHFG